MRFFFMAVLAVAILSIGCSKSGSLFGVDKGYGSVDIVAVAEDAPLFKTVAKKAEIIVTANDMSQSSKMSSVLDNAVRVG